jgi:hypothetical protein
MPLSIGFLAEKASKSPISCGFQSNSNRFTTNYLGIERHGPRLNGVQEAGSSNLLTQTNKPPEIGGF